MLGADHHPPRPKLIEHGGDGGHAGGERHGFAGLEPTNDFFECFPGRRAIIAEHSRPAPMMKFEAGLSGTFRGVPGAADRPAETSQDSGVISGGRSSILSK